MLAETCIVENAKEGHTASERDARGVPLALKCDTQGVPDQGSEYDFYK